MNYPYYYMNIGFSADFEKAFEYEFECKLEKEAKKFKGLMSGAGCGFGVRDINFVFKKEENAKKFKAWLGRRAKSWQIQCIDLYYEDGTHY